MDNAFAGSVLQNVSWNQMKQYLQSVSPDTVVGRGKKPGKSLAIRFVERQTGKRVAMLGYGEKARGSRRAIPAYVCFEGALLAHKTIDEQLSIFTLAAHLDPDETTYYAKSSWRVTAGDALVMMDILENSAEVLAWERLSYGEISRLYTRNREEYDQKFEIYNQFLMSISPIIGRIKGGNQSATG